MVIINGHNMANIVAFTGLSSLVLLFIISFANFGSARKMKSFSVKYLHVSGVPEGFPYYCYYCSCGREPDNNDSLVTECTSLGLYRPPKDIDNRTTAFSFRGNQYHRIKNYHFAGLENLRILDLSNNSIDQIEHDAFNDLVNLEQLYLHGQRLCEGCTLFLDDNVFKNLTSLKVLTLHHMLTSLAQARFFPMPSFALTKLINLEFLSIDGYSEMRFDTRYKPMSNLTSIYISGKDGICEIRSLTPYTFTGVTNIENITMEKCNIDTIDEKTFANLKRLRYLDLSLNIDISFDQFSNVACRFSSRYFRTLKINSIYNPNRAGIALKASHIRCFRNTTLEEIELEENGIAIIETGVFSLLPKSIKRLSLRRNKLTLNINMFKELFQYPHLEVLDAGDQLTIERSGKVAETLQVGGGFMFKRDVRTRYKDKYETKRDIHDIGTGDSFSYMHPVENVPEIQHRRKGQLDNGTRVDRNIALKPQSLEHQTKQVVKRDLANMGQFNAMDSKLKVVICSGTFSDFPLRQILQLIQPNNSVEYLDFARNFIPILESGAFRTLGRLRFLNMSANDLEYINGDMKSVLKGLDSLQMLDLSNNFLGDAIQQDIYGDLFSPLRSLRHLNISNNRIYRLGKQVFKELYELVTIDLSNNYIEVLECDFRHMIHLTDIDLSNNRIQTLPDSVRGGIQHVLTFHHLAIDLTQNKIACTCENIQFLEWLIGSNIHFKFRHTYTCTFTNQTTKVLDESAGTLIEALKEQCKSYQDVIIASSVGTGMVCAIIVSVAVYMNRWKLRYLYYTAKIRLEVQNKVNHEDEQYIYDVFLSYGDGDRYFVANDMVDNLETELGISLNIRDRDFEIGEVIAVNISKAIKQSKRTFLLVSRHFLANKWCNFEMNMARMEEVYQKRKVLVVIFLEEIPVKKLPMEIMNLLKEKPSIELPQNKDLRFPFWQTCRDHVN